MKGTTVFLLTALMLPMSASAQQDPSERLMHVLPEEIAAEVLARVETARSNRLPANAVASIALEGVAKGRSGERIRGIPGAGLRLDGARPGGRMTDCPSVAPRAGAPVPAAASDFHLSHIPLQESATRTHP